MDALAFLADPASRRLQPYYVLTGSESFLKRQSVLALRKVVLVDDPEGYGLSRHDGDAAEFAAVREDLDALSFLSPRKLVVVDRADKFISENRPKLEKLLPALGERTDPKSVLVLDADKWAATTKLAKLTPADRNIVCETPKGAALAQWCVTWCATAHGKALAANAARLLTDLIDAEEGGLGVLSQELAKLAVYVGDAKRIEIRDVDEIVARQRAEKVWTILDHIGGGKAHEALVHLQQLFEAGEEPIGLLAAIAGNMQRMAAATRLLAQNVPSGEAFATAGLKGFFQQKAETAMRHLGKRRLDAMYDLILQTDAGMKGGSVLTPRQLLERFVVKLAKARG